MIFFLILLFPFVVCADDAGSYADGKSLAHSLIQGPQSTKMDDIPSYEGKKVSASELYNKEETPDVSL